MMQFAARPGLLLLGVWLILTGLISLAGISFPQRDAVLAVLAARASFVRHNDRPPASSRSRLFGSSTNGATKFALPSQASEI